MLSTKEKLGALFVFLINVAVGVTQVPAPVAWFVWIASVIVALLWISYHYFGTTAVARLEVKAQIPVPAFPEGAPVHGIQEWRGAWIPVYVQVVNHGPSVAYEIELMLGTVDWIMEVQQTSGPSGLELKAGSGQMGPEMFLQFDDGTIGMLKDARMVGNRWRLYLPRLSKGDALVLVLGVAQPKDSKSRRESIERFGLGYRGSFVSAPGSVERHHLEGDALVAKPSASDMEAHSQREGA